MTDSIVIEVKDIKKQFGDIKAVDGISFSVGKGKIIALLGPNGAGKTTTINLLTTQLKPNSGFVKIMGFDSIKESKSVRKNIAVTFQETSIDLELTGKQILNFSGELYGMKKKEIKKKTEELLQMVDLSEAKNRKTKTYSGGMKRRLELVRSLMNSPNVLVLDEPTLGMDPQTRKKIWEYIVMLKEQKNMTILLTTHYLDEAEQLSDYVYIIDQGRIVQAGNASELIKELGTDTIRLKGEGNIQDFSNKIENLSYVELVNSDNINSLHIGVDSGQKRATELLKIALECQFSVHEIEIVTPDLGDVFFNATGNEIRE
ncbi:MAG: ATP-binding cassette domain-containing protein [Bacteroidetes bacterium]|nr:ATP-binding cassette domain-containing protein [Bacteroidota bacterium]